MGGLVRPPFSLCCDDAIEPIALLLRLAPEAACVPLIATDLFVPVVGKGCRPDPVQPGEPIGFTTQSQGPLLSSTGSPRPGWASPQSGRVGCRERE